MTARRKFNDDGSRPPVQYVESDAGVKQPSHACVTRSPALRMRSLWRLHAARSIDWLGTVSDNPPAAREIGQSRGRRRPSCRSRAHPSTRCRHCSLWRRCGLSRREPRRRLSPNSQPVPGSSPSPAGRSLHSPIHRPYCRPSTRGRRHWFARRCGTRPPISRRRMPARTLAPGRRFARLCRHRVGRCRFGPSTMPCRLRDRRRSGLSGWWTPAVRSRRAA